MEDKKQSNENLSIYNAVRKPPQEAIKSINGGRLKGMSDINPLWRIKTLTEQFGICGFGWKYTITKQWIEHGAKDEISAFVNIDLFVKVNGEWSEAIPGTGGSAFVALESRGLYTSDECFKMALTDALSVCCKALGFAADIYWDKDRTKYDQQAEKVGNVNDTPEEKRKVNDVADKRISTVKAELLKKTATDAKVPIERILEFCKVKTVEDITEEWFGAAMNKLKLTMSVKEEY